VAIIGAGMSGICAAIMLREAGITDITIYEKAADLGGTWRDNTYPGLTCDVPSRAYQFTFAKNPDWSNLFSPGAEIQAYFRAVADDYGLANCFRFNTEITRAEFVADHWRIATGSGQVETVDFLISATGILHHPRYPQIVGLDDFAGPVFHSARWDHDVDLVGKRIAVIGTGSTGVQIVCGLSSSVGRLELFQRTAQWILPLKNRQYTRIAKAAYARAPWLGALAYGWYRRQLEFFARALIKPGWRRRLLSAACRRSLHAVDDPALRSKLTPDYQPMCKRLVVSSEFYAAMQRPNVALVTDPIDHVEARGIVTSDGELHEVDVIALATGFDAHAFLRPTQLIGRDGITLDEAWRDGPRAHLTVALPGFPNFFMMLGPHSPVGNYSLTAIAETQAAHIRDWITRWESGQFDTVAPTEVATATFNSEMREAMPGTVWTTGCSSWYLGKDGLPELWPWTPDQHRIRLSTPNLSRYDLRVGPDPVATAAPDVEALPRP
jgi:cation diffusion facilitator CzcD-associated flavoprotein CzcO